MVIYGMRVTGEIKLDLYFLVLQFLFLCCCCGVSYRDFGHLCRQIR